jgi:olefin beta-lactone synthetase
MLDELAASLATDTDRPALLRVRFGRVTVRATRGHLAELAGAYATALHARGLGAGDTIGFAVRPGPRAIALMLAASRLRLRVAVLDPGAGPDVLASRVGLAEPRLVLADAAAQAVAGWARPLARRARIALPELASLAPVLTVGPRLPFSAPSLNVHSGLLPPPRPDDGDAVMIFTSGTTGSPRAVVHTWASLDAGMRAVADLVAPTPGSTVLGGTFFVMMPALARRAAVVLPSSSLARQLDAVRPHETYLTPPQLRDALDAGARFHGRVWTGSAPVSASLLSRVLGAGASAAFGVYALTEMFPVAVVSAAEKAAFDGTGDLVGPLIPGVQADVDPSGQLLLRGPGAFDRYLGEAPAGEVRTGDLARLDGSTVVLAGRAKDMILRGAENIYPGLYEPSLHVAGVTLAVLVGVPAADGDERVVAVVQLAPGADPSAVRAALRPALDRMGAARPDTVVLADIPVAGRSRKPDRAALAARLSTMDNRS